GARSAVESTTRARAVFVHEMSPSTEIADISPRQAAMMARSRANRRFLLHATARASSIGTYPYARAAGKAVPTPKRTTADGASRGGAAAYQVTSACRAVSAECGGAASTQT